MIHNYNEINDYSNITVAHSKLISVFEKLKGIDRPSSREKVIVLTGPTGVGKTTVVERLTQDILARYRQEMIDDPSFVPVVIIRMPAPIGGDFNWKDAFIRVLEQFNEVLIRRKVVNVPIIELDGEVVSNPRGLVREELRRSVRNCIKHRRTLLLIIDEASHLLIAKYRSFYLQQFELIKSLSQDFQIPLLLSGAYDLLDIRQFNGQLIRRSEIIHFPRYSYEEFADENNEDGQSFRNTVHTLLEKMPIEKEPGLIEHMDFFFMRSLGCIGILKSWMQKAFEEASETSDRMLTREIIAQTSRPNIELKAIATEIKLGESRLADISPIELAKTLGMSEVPDLFNRHIRVASPSPEITLPVPKRALPPRSKRPGTRNPVRDLVGV
ncbi:hypothetical protein GALLN_00924 [Gallionellaceae bacterium]|nr:hypothetical protein GALLN_00924 [Gallionellaceae bacterium]